MMRVHEFAKQHDLTSKQLLEALREAGLEAKSHMSVLSDEGVTFLEKRFVHKSTAKEVLASPVDTSSSEKVNPRAKSEVKLSTFTDAEEATAGAGRSPLVLGRMSVGDFAQRTGVPTNEVILSLLKEGKPCAKNQLLVEEDILKLCEIYEIEAIVPKAQKRDVLGEKTSLSEENREKRLPVVVVMGHVDHGKTTLLDFIRKSRVAAKERGGITQHLGAYRVPTEHGDLVFLDTPGHEAFSKIRKRGASVADVAILMIAADDGIMPQTLESIKAIKALDIPVIVAINKIDRVDEQRIEVVKRQLAQHDMLPEEWGGSTVCVPLSAKEGKGVGELLELLVLQAEMMDLKASLSEAVQGYILESKMLKGRGPVATVLCQQGTLKIGQPFQAGEVVGRVVSLTDSSGSSLKEAGPSVPLLVAGFSGLPAVGALFKVITESDYKRARTLLGKASPAAAARWAVSNDLQKFNMILKADTHSSLEAIFDAIKKFSKKEVKEIVMIRSGVGNISESDALLAESTGAIIVGFGVKAEHNALLCARKTSVRIFLFDIIYKLLEELQEMAERKKEIKTVLTKIGQATVLKVFNIKKIGVIAGCVVNDGRFSDKGIVAVIQNRKEVARGKIKSLQRDKKTVKEVHTGFECAFIVEGFEDWQEGDVAECYVSLPSV